MKCARKACASTEVLPQKGWAKFVAGIVLGFVLVFGSEALAAQARYPQEQVIPDHVDKFTKTNWERDDSWPRGDCGDLKDAYGRPLADCSVPWPEVPVNERGRAWLAYFDVHQSPTLNECAAITTPTLLGDVRPFNFLFKTDRLVITYEHAGVVRTVWMDGRGHPPPTDLYYHGHSVGWWEGEELVVESQNFTFDPDGLDDHIHLASSTRKRVVERYKLVDENTMSVVITYEDPVFLDGPVTWEQRWVKTDEPLDGWWECNPEITRREIELTYPEKYSDN